MMKLESGTFSIVPIKSLLGLHPYQQVIYMWLCHHANSENQCWPSLNTLAKECNISKRSIIRYLDKLEESGFLVKNPRVTSDEENLSNLYTVIIKGGDSQSQVVSDSHYPSDCESLGVVSDSHPNYINSLTKTNITTSSSDFPKTENPEEEEKSLKIRKIKKECSEIPYQKIANLFNEIFKDENIANVIKVTAKRQAQIRGRWGNELKSIEEWEKYFLRIKKSDFLCGRKADKNGKKFFADFDWVISESGCVRVLEDKYSNVRYEHG